MGALSGAQERVAMEVVVTIQSGSLIHVLIQAPRFWGLGKSRKKSVVDNP